MFLEIYDVRKIFETQLGRSAGTCVVCDMVFVNENYSKFHFVEHENDPGIWLPNYFRAIYEEDSKRYVWFCGCQCGTNWCSEQPQEILDAWWSKTAI